MGRVELETYADEAALAAAVASAWLAELKRVQPTGRVRCVALAGGRVAKKFFEEVTCRVREGKGSVEGVEFFWGDERCVEPGDAESNYRAAAELMLQPLGVSADRIHRIEGELSPELAATRAAAALRDRAGEAPVLDWVFLGMGEDGHVASLFPAETAAVRSDCAIYRSVWAVKPPPRRITLGYGPIVAAREVWVLASGKGKETALRASLAVDGTTPLARVIGLRERTRVFTDIRWE